MDIVTLKMAKKYTNDEIASVVMGGIDVPPSSPNAKDDEFPGISLDGKWTQMKSAQLTVDRTAAGNLGLSSSGEFWTGIYQAIPSGDFIATAKVGYFWPSGDVWAGLLIGSATGDSPALRGVILHAESNPITIRSTYWNSPTDWNSDQVLLPNATRYGYLRLQRVGTTITLYYSIDGVFFKLIQSFTQPFTPATIGLFNGGGAVDFQWFRVTE